MRQIVLLSVMAAALCAQTVDRSKPPATPPLAPYKLPPITEFKLGNGMPVMLVEDRRFPLITLSLGFQAGTKFDPKNLDGLSETVASLLKEGTKTRSAQRLAEELAMIGGSLDAASSDDFLIIRGLGLSEHTAKLLELAADMARNASFPEDEVKLRKQNREQELLAARAESNTLAEERLRKAVFGDHPYGSLLPTAQSIEKITRESLMQFRDRFLIPNQALLILVGALPPREELRKILDERFGSWQSKPPQPEPAAKFPAPKRALILVDRPGSAQVDIHAGKLSVTRTSPDYFPLSVGSGVLGGGASSRMFQNIREKQGFAYDAHTELTPFKDAGVFQAVTQVREEVLEPAMQALFDEMTKMGKEPVGAHELSDQKSFMTGLFALRMETQTGVANQLTNVKLAGMPNEYLESYVTRIRSVEPDQIEKAARKYASPGDAAIVVVGDASKIAKKLEKFGPAVVEKAK